MNLKSKLYLIIEIEWSTCTLVSGEEKELREREISFSKKTMK